MRWVETIQLALIAAMFAAAVAVWPVAPDSIPVHWDISGQVDRYGGKLEGLFGIPLLAVGIYLTMRFLPRFDPGRANYAQFSGTYAIMRLAIIATIAALYGFLLLTILGLQLNMAVLVPVVVGGLLIVIGNFMGKIRPNWFVGLRTPWTLSSKEAWTKAHRLAGWLLIGDGVALIAIGLLQAGWALSLWIAATLGGILWLVVYSYLVWRSDPHKTPPAGTSPAVQEDEPNARGADTRQRDAE